MKKLLLLPKVWFHGSQSTITWWRPRKRPYETYCSWFHGEHAVGVDTPLGVPVEPEVRGSCERVRPTRANARSDFDAAGARADPRPESGRADRRERGRELRGIGSPHQPGRSSSKIDLSFGEVLRHQRVRRRDRRDRHADVHRASASSRVVERVVERIASGRLESRRRSSNPWPMRRASRAPRGT